MSYLESEVDGVWTYHPKTFFDSRGYFREWFKRSTFASHSGIDFTIEQSNLSISKKNVLRGIHFSVAKQGQAKWVTCVNGDVTDLVIDLRESSPTFMKHIFINLTAESGQAIYIPEGCGHAFLSNKDSSIVVYSLSSEYDPEKEFAINPLDPKLGINWPVEIPILSEKDRSAPNFDDLTINGV